MTPQKFVHCRYCRALAMLRRSWGTGNSSFLSGGRTRFNSFNAEGTESTEKNKKYRVIERAERLTNSTPHSLKSSMKNLLA